MLASLWFRDRPAIEPSTMVGSLTRWLSLSFHGNQQLLNALPSLEVWDQSGVGPFLAPGQSRPPAISSKLEFSRQTANPTHHNFGPPPTTERLPLTQFTFLPVASGWMLKRIFAESHNSLLRSFLTRILLTFLYPQSIPVFTHQGKTNFNQPSLTF